MATAVAPAKGAKKGKQAPDAQTLLLAAAAGSGTAADDAGELLQVRVALVDPSPYQPRTTFDEAELQQLADSLRVNGLLQPIVVRYSGTEHRERYELIAGERRLRAAKLCGWEFVPALVKRMGDAAAAANAAIENLQRAQLTPLEEAEAFARLMREQGWSQQQLAERLGVPRSTVGDRVRVLTLPAPWLALIRDGSVVQLSHAPALLPYVPAPAAVHAAAVERFRKAHYWQAAVSDGRPIYVTAMPAFVFEAYGLDLWDLSRGGLAGEYAGAVVTVPRDRHDREPRRYAADPTVWLPMREAAKQHTAEETRRFAVGGGAAIPAAPGVGHPATLRGAEPPTRTLRDDVVLQLPDNHGPPVTRALWAVPNDVALLTDAAGRWNVGNGAGAWEADPADLVLANETFVEVTDTLEGVRRVGTTDQAAVDAAEARWTARWTAREAELRAASTTVDYALRGEGVRLLLAMAVDDELDSVSAAVRASAEAVTEPLPAAVRDEVEENGEGWPGQATRAWALSAPLAAVEAAATALVRLDAECRRGGYGDPATKRLAGEQAAALAEIAARPVPWVVARPKLPSDENRGLFDEEPAAAEGDDGDEIGLRPSMLDEPIDDEDLDEAEAD